MKKLPLILGGVLVVGILAMLFLKPDVDIQQKVASGPTKVGFVYLTNPGDHGWTYAHEVGRQELQAHFGDKVETSYVENVPEGPDAARVIRELAEKGNKERVRSTSHLVFHFYFLLLVARPSPTLASSWCFA